MPNTRKRGKYAPWIIIGAVFALPLLGVGFAQLRDSGTESTGVETKVALAQCLTENGVRVFGAYWCPHCKKQKEMFGEAAWKEIKYIECAAAGNPRAQTQECQNEKIEGYPTWIFPDGKRLTGEQALTDLAEESQCPFEG